MALSGSPGVYISQSQAIVRFRQRRVEYHGALKFLPGMRQIVALLVGDSQIVMRAGVLRMVPDQRGKLLDGRLSVSGAM